MLFSYLTIALALVAALILTLLHLPGWLARVFHRFIPAWVQALGVHALGYIVRGVTGHVVGAMASIPYYVIGRYWLRPRMLRP